MSRVGDFFKRSSVNPKHPRDPSLAAIMGFGASTASGASVTAESAMRVAGVYACIRVRALAMAQIPLHLYNMLPNGGLERATDHPLYEILHLRPNTTQTSFEWRESSIAHIDLRGDAYSRILTNAAGRIEALLPLNPDQMWPFASEGRVAYRYFNPDGTTKIYLDHEILRLPGLSFDPFGRSLSPIELHKNTIGNSLTSTEYQGHLWRNSAVPKGGIETPATLDDAAVKAMRKAWNDRHAGPENSGQIALFHGGMKWVDIGMSHDDLQYVELMGMGLSDIARIYGVQPHKIGDLSRSTNNNIEQQALEFVTDVIAPMAQRWEQRMMISLLSPAERKTYKIAFDLNGLLRGDSAARAALYRVLFACGALKPQDMRRLEGLDLLDGDAAEQTYVQINMAPLNQLLEVLMKASAPQPGDGTDDGFDQMKEPKPNGKTHLNA